MVAISKAKRSRAAALCILFALFAGVWLAATGVAPAQAGRQGTAEAEPRSGDLTRRAVTALDEGRYVRARELASQALESKPDSVVPLFVLASALHEGEGNIPRALHVIRRARAAVESSPVHMVGAAQGGWHHRILQRQLWILSDLGRYEELIRIAGLIRERYDPDYFAIEVWPRMKRGELELARQAAARAIATGAPYEEIIARNGLCAIDGLKACEEMLQAVRDYGAPPGLALRNVAVAVAAAGDYERAERLLLESIEHPTPETNPWSLLTDLYLGQARFAEAASSAKEMIDYARHMPPRERQHSRAGELAVSASVLMLVGQPGRAAALSSEAMSEPDRAAHWAGSSEEIAADVHLLHHAVQRSLAEMAAEAASILPWYESLPSRATALSHRLAAWSTARRLMPLLLEGGLRVRDAPHQLAQPSLSAPSWLQMDAIGLLGPGPALDLVAELRSRGPAPGSAMPEKLREALLSSMEAEAHGLLGHAEECLRTGSAARATLPGADRLLRARLAARMADAAWQLGDWERAAPLYDEVLRVEPGTLRRTGLELPVAVGACRTDVGCAAIERAAGSPRFARDDTSPFQLAEVGDRICLAARNGARMACAPLTSDPADAAEAREEPDPEPLGPEQVDDPASRAALSLVRKAFTPPIDLTQQALDSLDGAPTARRGLERETLGDLLWGR
jgi:tetratricopeptide (TPR) repeat protein